jgi:hypothetical protein
MTINRAMTFLISICTWLFVVSGAVAIEQFRVGDDVRVACVKLSVHSKPDARVLPIDEIKFGAALQVTSLKKTFKLPDSDFNSKSKLEKAAKEQAGDELRLEEVLAEEYTRAAWLGIGNGQFVSSSCIVTEALFKEQNTNTIKGKLQQITQSKKGGKKGFSSDEEGDQTALKGAAGKAKLGKANLNLVDKYVQAADGSLNYKNLQAFRKAGGLGEYR